MGSLPIATSPFAGIAEGNIEAGTTLSKIYADDPHGSKVTLLRGAYEAKTGVPFVPPATFLAREKLLQDPKWHHDYLPFLGAANYLRLGEKLMFGCDSASIKSGLVASMQTVGATGALHMGGRFLKKNYPGWAESTPKLYLTEQTWVNHRNLFDTLGIEVGTLPYYQPSIKAVDFAAFKDSLLAIPPGSVVLLQTAAHNPTGCDLTSPQWGELSEVFLARRHLAFLDSAYLGLASGDVERDSRAVHCFEAAGVPLLLATTFGKSFGLYGERVGMLSVVAPSRETRRRIESQMILLARSETGCSPGFGARVVEEVLSSPELTAVWEADVKGVAEELQRRRRVLQDELSSLRTPGDWNFLTEQVGMFSLLDLSPSQLEFLRLECHLYIDSNTRLSFASVDDKGLALVALGLDKMVRQRIS